MYNTKSCKCTNNVQNLLNLWSGGWLVEIGRLVDRSKDRENRFIDL